MDTRKLQTRKNYQAIHKLYTADFGQDREHFNYIDEVANHVSREFPCVDLGCGSGVVTDYLLEKGVASVMSIDLCAEFCDMLRTKYPKQVQIVCDDMVAVTQSFANESIAAYIANFSLIHIPDEEIDPLFSTIYRTLIPSGYFLLSVHHGSFKGMEQEPYQTQGDTRLKTDISLMIYMNYFTPEELKARLTNIGFKISHLDVFPPKAVAGEIAVPKIWILVRK